MEHKQSLRPSESRSRSREWPMLKLNPDYYYLEFGPVLQTKNKNTPQIELRRKKRVCLSAIYLCYPAPGRAVLVPRPSHRYDAVEQEQARAEMKIPPWPPCARGKDLQFGMLHLISHHDGANGTLRPCHILGLCTLNRKAQFSRVGFPAVPSTHGIEEEKKHEGEGIACVSQGVDGDARALSVAVPLPQRMRRARSWG